MPQSHLQRRAELVCEKTKHSSHCVSYPATYASSTRRSPSTDNTELAVCSFKDSAFAVIMVQGLPASVMGCLAGGMVAGWPAGQMWTDIVFRGFVWICIDVWTISIIAGL